jgi:hypothetical protein
MSNGAARRVRLPAWASEAGPELELTIGGEAVSIG